MAQSAFNDAMSQGVDDEPSSTPVSVDQPPRMKPGDAARPGKLDPPNTSGKTTLTFKKRMQLAVASLIGTTTIRTLAWTYRYRVHYGDQVYKGRAVPPQLDAFRGTEGRPLLFALWHGTCFPILSFWRDRGVCAITSRSTDGQALARILHRLGFQTVSGSSSRGGTRALIDLTHVVKAGGDAAIAVDGPRGPAMEVKPGIVLLAKLTGRPIIPLVATAKRYYQFQSWDRFRLPLPFTQAVIMGDDPIHVPPDADHELMETIRLELEHRMRKLQDEVDAKVQPKVWKRADRVRRKTKTT